MVADLRRKMPFLDWGQIYREQIHWSQRDLSGEKGKQLQSDMLAYVDWAVEFVRHENNRTIEEGHVLYAKMTSWNPEDFPLKVIP